MGSIILGLKMKIFVVNFGIFICILKIFMKFERNMCNVRFFFLILEIFFVLIIVFFCFMLVCSFDKNNILGFFL